MLKRALVAVPVAVLLLAACGGNDDDGDTGSSLSADEQEAADNLAAQIIRSGAVSGRGAGEDAVTEQQATCIAEGAVGDVGLAALQDYGIVTEDLLVNKDIQGVRMSEGDADALAGVFVACIDAERLFEKKFLAAGGKGESAQVRACIEEAVDTAGVRAALAASFSGKSTPAAEQLGKNVSACSGEDVSGE